jgi:hypothetical protein
VAGKFFETEDERLGAAAGAIEEARLLYAQALGTFDEQANQLSAGQGALDAYNDVIQDVLRNTAEAVAAFEALDANLLARALSLGITAGNYLMARLELEQRYAGLGGDG